MLRLPIEKITSEFEKKFSDRVKPYSEVPKIRQIKEDDYESIVPIYNRAYKNLHEKILPINVDIIKDMDEDPESVILVAELDNNIAGLIILEYEGQNNEFVTITDWAVSPKFRRKGIGTRLCVAAWENFKPRGVKEIRCEVYVNNPVAHNFIKSMGFEEIRTDYY
ncbi:MAG: GNAT family N-acetyltransferase [Promethearchaeota archaeon]